MDQIDKKQKKTERQRKMFVQSLNMYVYFLLQDNANMAGWERGDATFYKFTLRPSVCPFISRSLQST